MFTWSLTDQIMASPAWLPVEVQSSASQNPVTGLPAGGPSGGPPTPTGAIAPASVATIPTSDGASGTASNSIQESAQGKFVNAPPHVLPGPSFSYSGIPHVTTASGTSQQLPSGSVSTTSYYCFFFFFPDGCILYVSWSLICVINCLKCR